ncbi:MAG: precorrin-6y C5,15-methyltransferase (decarboxylating) subunit CbiE [Alkalinema sp. RU_4_3]|nr:precorrin-6y C5,15-methyltransferase (decarboxylating) subunit CbiE [Alkalinema sp. RU_4_3]
MTQPWLSIIGIGENGWSDLSTTARSLIDQAQILIGGQRHLDLIPPGKQERFVWLTPISESIAQIQSHQGQRVCVLASGDPMCYGIGNTLLRSISRSEMEIIPAPSAFSLAAAKLGWDLGQVSTISLCGRPPEALNLLVTNNARILILSSDKTTPKIVAKQITQQGFGLSEMQVLEHLGGPKENVIRAIASQWDYSGADLNLIALTCKAEANHRGFSRLAGLPDTAYIHDGQLTKREIRTITLAALAPLPGELLWDVGSGCGSIAIEWMRSHPNCRAIAIEHHPTRLENIAQNANTLGVPGLQIQPGTAPTALTNLPPPDAIFIGGGLTADGVFDRCWAALPSGGRLVANGVTIESERLILNQQAILGGELLRISVERTYAIGRFLGWKALSPIIQWQVIKP